MKLIPELHDHTCKGECSRCGECCTMFIPLSKDELTKIKSYVKKHNIQPSQHLCSEGFKVTCCFFDPNNKCCKIYPVRPYVCKDFMCSNKDWKERRLKYDKRADYNSTTKDKLILAALDDLIYDDYNPIIQYIIYSLQTSCKEIDSELIIKGFTLVNRLDLLKYFSCVDDKDNNITGLELYKQVTGKEYKE